MRDILVSLFLLFSAPVSAQKITDITPDMANGQPTATLLKMRGNVTGVWLPMPTAKKVLENQAIVTLKQAEINKKNQYIELKEKEIKLLQQSLTTTSRIANTWKIAAQNMERMHNRKQTWWSTPYFWVPVGIIVGFTAGYCIADLRK